MERPCTVISTCRSLVVCMVNSYASLCITLGENSSEVSARSREDRVDVRKVGLHTLSSAVHTRSRCSLSPSAFEEDFRTQLFAFCLSVLGGSLITFLRSFHLSLQWRSFEYRPFVFFVKCVSNPKHAKATRCRPRT